MAKNRDTLVSIHSEARRERLLDMEERVRRYRLACFGILALALARWWQLDRLLVDSALGLGLAGFADRRSLHA